MSPVTPKPAAEFSTLAMTKSRPRCSTSAGIARRAISRPGLPKMSPMNRICIDQVVSGRAVAAMVIGISAPRRSSMRGKTMRSSPRLKRRPGAAGIDRDLAAARRRRSGRRCARRDGRRRRDARRAARACGRRRRACRCVNVAVTRIRSHAGEVDDDFDRRRGFDDVDRRAVLAPVSAAVRRERNALERRAGRRRLSPRSPSILIPLTRARTKSSGHRMLRRFRVVRV